MEQRLNDWTVKLSKDDKEIEYRNFLCKNDWVYTDNDREYSVFDELQNGASQKQALFLFTNNTSSYLDMNKKETDILYYLITKLNFDDIWHCIRTISKNMDNNMYEFIKKYNFHITPNI